MMDSFVTTLKRKAPEPTQSSPSAPPLLQSVRPPSLTQMLERERRGRGTPVKSSLPGNHNLATLLRDLNPPAHQAARSRPAPTSASAAPSALALASHGPPAAKRQRVGAPVGLGGGYTLGKPSWTPTTTTTTTTTTTSASHRAPAVTLKRMVGNAIAGRGITPAERSAAPASTSAPGGGGGGGGNCFKCGNTGHWAAQCSASGSGRGTGATGGRGVMAAGAVSRRGGFSIRSGGRGQTSSTSGAATSAKPRGVPPSVESLMAKVGAKLSAGQARGLELALKGNSIFFTGSAGTGKSLLLREMVRLLREIHGDDAVYVTASTGLAACNIGGCTLHSYAGVGLGEQSQEVLVTKVLSSKRSRDRWVSTKVLIVDEVSMLEGTLFDKLEYVARKVRNYDAPFGGIQLVLSGDFLQLPPVQTKFFCFESAAWKKVVREVIVLTHVFRQSDDAFVALLNDLRVGKVTEEGQRMLSRCMIPYADRARSIHRGDDRIQATLLYPHRRDVDDENTKRLADLSGTPRVYRAIDSGVEPYRSTLSRNCPAPDVLELKLNAQVILLKNLDSALELVNGARGVVVDFKKPVKQDNKEEAYDESKEYPEVLFTSGVRRVITPEEWSVEVAGEQQACRVQCPLALAWALSIHKAQGMSISKVQMKLGNIWEYGQGYVALSRATSMDGLYIMDLNEKGIVAHPKVLQFYADMEAQQQREREEGRRV